MRFRRSEPVTWLCLALFFAGCGAPDGDTQLAALFDEEWDFRLGEYPLFASSVGDHSDDDRLTSMTLEDLARRNRFRLDLLDRLAAIDRARLSTEDRINYDMFERQLRDAVEDYEFKGYRIPILADAGFHISFARLPSQTRFTTVQNYENYTARLRAFPTYVEQHIELMREAIETGYTQPRVILDGYEHTIEAHIVDDALASVFYAPFKAFPPSVPEGERGRLETEGQAAIMEAVVHGYQMFLDFMLAEYIPNARTTTGASDLPRGREYYDYLIRHYTTLDVTADEVHQMGLDEVARIRAEMDGVIAETGFRGDFAEFLEFLRTDPQFYANTAEQLLTRAAAIAKEMDGKLPSLFKTLPRQPYGVEPVPEHIAPKYTAGRYVGAALDSKRAGTYWVNTYALESRPLYVLPSLTLHEAVPGHHLQNALRLELEGLPNFRRYSGIGAYGEGWGLYSEWLGIEAGIYKDPYSNFGRLTYEMWRACRLVVDTGLHAMGWTRDQAMDFLASNTALSLHEVRTETDRYISWPGQALSYKMGELKIRGLRQRATDALGEKFDVREFHDVVLLNGPIPLTVLENLVDAYISNGTSD